MSASEEKFSVRYTFLRLHFLPYIGLATHRSWGLSAIAAGAAEISPGTIFHDNSIHHLSPFFKRKSLIQSLI